MVRTRIAPSPTGYPHIGTLFQGLFDYVYARKHSGRFIIRIEDTDRTRFVADAEDKLYAAFEWLGITPDEGPKYGGSFGPYRQSERLELYAKYAQQLVDTDHAYYCFCSQERLDQIRQEQQKNGNPPMYDQHCRTLDKAEAQTRAQKEPHVIRLRVPKGKQITVKDLVRGEIHFLSDIVDDQVLLKSDGFPTYHLAVVVDDHLMEISHIIRGEEWLSSAPKHVLLFEFLDWEMPKIFHTPLLRNLDRSKLSKRHGHASVSWYQEQGYLPEAVINFLASRVWNHPEDKEVYGLEELILLFDWKDMHIQGPVVDLDKLNWLNGQWIRRLTEAELLERVKPFMKYQVNDESLKRVLPLVKERLVTLSQIEPLTRYFFTDPDIAVTPLLKMSKMNETEIKQYLTDVSGMLERLTEFSAATLELKMRELQEGKGLKPKPAFMTLRLVLTGQEATPPLFEIMEVFGKQLVLERIKRVLNILD